MSVTVCQGHVRDGTSEDPCPRFGALRSTSRCGLVALTTPSFMASKVARTAVQLPVLVGASSPSSPTIEEKGLTSKEGWRQGRWPQGGRQAGGISTLTHSTTPCSWFSGGGARRGARWRRGRGMGSLGGIRYRVVEPGCGGTVGLLFHVGRWFFFAWLVV
jgi:hypothetical protein